jgi:hypothetical protein
MTGRCHMILALSARVNANVVQIAGATAHASRDYPIDVLTSRVELHGLAVDRILGLQDGSMTVLDRAAGRNHGRCITAQLTSGSLAL